MKLKISEVAPIYRNTIPLEGWSLVPLNSVAKQKINFSRLLQCRRGRGCYWTWPQVCMTKTRVTALLLSFNLLRCWNSSTPTDYWGRLTARKGKILEPLVICGGTPANQRFLTQHLLPSLAPSSPGCAGGAEIEPLAAAQGCSTLAAQSAEWKGGHGAEPPVCADPQSRDTKCCCSLYLRPACPDKLLPMDLAPTNEYFCVQTARGTRVCWDPVSVHWCRSQIHFVYLLI